MTTFKDRAQIGLDRGIPVIRVAARAKKAYDNDWPNLATTDPEVIAKQDAETPGCNTGFVAQAKIGGVWILETDSVKPAKAYEEATGKKFTPTFTVQSSKGGHRYYKHNEASIAMGNIGQQEADGFSVRANNQYCLGPLSIHPTGAVYMTKLDGPIVEADPEMIEWLVAQKKNKSAVQSFSPGNGKKVPHGGINAYMLNVGGILRNLNLPPDALKEALLAAVHENCEAPIDEKKVIQMAEWLNKQDTSELGKPTVYVSGGVAGVQVAKAEPEPFKLAKIEDLEVLGMPDSIVPDCKLGEIFYNRLGSDFPIDYGWIALVHAAGVLVPPSPRSPLTISDGEDLTSFYTALIGPVNSGKTQAANWARFVLGITDGKPNYFLVKSGSAEGLFPALEKRQRGGTLGDRVYVDVEELSYLFSKIAIEGSSYAPVLTSGFNKKEQTLIIKGGKEINLNCALSWMGGIVTDQFESCFGSATTGGLYDRFMFGMCPTGYSFVHRPFEGGAEVVNPVPVSVDGSVFEVTRTWKREHPELTREVELAVRFAKVIASFDGKSVLRGKDMEAAPMVFALEQSRIRQILKPNAGNNPDAKFANAIMSLLKRKTKPGEWLDMRDVKQNLNVFRENLGPSVMQRALDGLLRAKDIEMKTDPTRRNGKTAIRLVVEDVE